MNYETLLNEADALGLIVKEVNLIARDGICKGNRIAIDKKINTTIEKTCVLAEELGHHHLTVGDITDQSKINNVKQEIVARQWAYKKLVGILDIIRAFEHGSKTIFEMADFLNVTEEFLQEAIKYYKCKHGLSCEIDNYIVYFEPNLGILKMY